MYHKLFDEKNQKAMVKYFYEELSKKGHIREYRKNEIIKAVDTDSIYIVVEGYLRQFLSDAKGHEKELFRLNAGTIFGEMDYFEGEKTCVNTIAMKNSKISVVDSALLEAELRKNPEIYKHFLHSVTRKYRLLMTEIGENLFNDSIGKLVSLLLRTGAAQRGKLKDGIIMKYTFTHEELATRVGCSRITITKGLKQLKTEGLIAYRGKYIELKNIKGLQGYVNHLW